MQPVEVRQAEKNVATECLEPAAGIAGTVAQNGAAHAVGDARLQFFERGGPAPDTLARHQSDAGSARGQRLEQCRNKHRIVLSVTIERHHNRSTRMAP